MLLVMRSTSNVRDCITFESKELASLTQPGLDRIPPAQGVLAVDAGTLEGVHLHCPSHDRTTTGVLLIFEQALISVEYLRNALHVGLNLIKWWTRRRPGPTASHLRVSGLHPARWRD